MACKISLLKTSFDFFKKIEIDLFIYLFICSEFKIQIKTYTQLSDFLSLFFLLGWLVGWFYGVSNLFGSFNAEMNFKQFSLV